MDSGTALMSVPPFAEEVFNEANIPTFNSPRKCES